MGSRRDPAEPDEPSDDWRRALHDAAVAAERETGAAEPTVEAAERHIVLRLVRAGFGFLLIGIGIALVPLPGPGWLVIVIGLSMLPFVWAERLVHHLRRRMPGIPDDGRIPPRTAAIGVVALVVSTIVTISFGAEITRWAAVAFGNPDRIFG